MSVKVKAEVTLEKCRSLLNAVYIKDAGSEPGKVRYALFIGDRRVTTSEKPTITSNCASIINTDIGADIVRIDYDFGNCYEEPGNHVRVAYRIYRKMVDKKFFFGADADILSSWICSGDLGYDSKSGRSGVTTELHL
ncbi:MAG: hypothetical protein U5L09_11200 [Bacteroidales bacterium]|nr:hypothetical protein [Bacteroidales bacterium]